MTRGYTTPPAPASPEQAALFPANADGSEPLPEPPFAAIPAAPERGVESLTKADFGEPPKTGVLLTNASIVGQRSSEAISGHALRRRRRWEMMYIVWQHSSLARVTKCGRVTVHPRGVVGVRCLPPDTPETPPLVGFSGLSTCSSVWACPRCSAKIQARRRTELGVLVAMAAQRGYSIAFGTMTLRHHAGQRLSALVNTLNECQRAVSQSRKVKDLRADLDRQGYVRTVEVTHGENGWHPHIHRIEIFKQQVTQDDLDSLADAEFSAWRKKALRMGLDEPLRERYEIKLVTRIDKDLSDYLTKDIFTGEQIVSEKDATSIGFEMTGSVTKKGKRKGSRTPWQLIMDYEVTEDARLLALWNEYEQAMHGKKMLTWSRGLKAEYGLRDVKDEKIAEEELGGSEDTLFYILDWTKIASSPLLPPMLLEAVERDGLEGGRDFCEAYGVEYELT